MKLVKLKVKNFRCYKEETEFFIDDLTSIIGKNDIGKSALLDALDAFFNDIIDAGDRSTNADNTTVEITCYFDQIPERIILDTSMKTSPIDEGILNDENLLEVKKTYTFGGRKSSAIFLIANHLDDPKIANILRLNNRELKQLADELGVDLKGIDKRQNPSLRSCIRAHVGGNQKLHELKIDGGVGSEGNLKTIWKSLSLFLPVYSLFKCDKAFNDKDGDIKDPMQSAIDEALNLPDIKNLLQQVEDKVKKISTDVADKTIQKLLNFDKSLSENLRSEFNRTPSYGKIFDLTLLNENNIPLNKRGSGIRRLVILSFFQAQAENKKVEKNSPSIIYAIEEPETSQHPDHQRMIVNTLCELAEQDGVQVLFTTHSANLVREIPIDSLRFVSAGSGGQVQIEDGKDNSAVIDKVIKTLGILPNPSDRVKVLVYMEGNNDVHALKRYSEILHQDDNAIPNLQASDYIGYVITGGSALKHYIEEHHLAGLGKPEVHIYDSDVPAYKELVEKMNTTKDGRKIGFTTTKLEMECYLHQDAIAEAYEGSEVSGVKFEEITDTKKVPYQVAEKIYSLKKDDWCHLDEKKRKELADRRKNILNTTAVKKMTIDRIKEREGYEEIRLWLKTIKDISE